MSPNRPRSYEGKKGRLPQWYESLALVPILDTPQVPVVQLLYAVRDQKVTHIITYTWASIY